MNYTYLIPLHPATLRRLKITHRCRTLWKLYEYYQNTIVFDICMHARRKVLHNTRSGINRKNGIFQQPHIPEFCLLRTKTTRRKKMPTTPPKYEGPFESQEEEDAAYARSKHIRARIRREEEEEAEAKRLEEEKKNKGKK